MAQSQGLTQRRQKDLLKFLRHPITRKSCNPELAQLRAGRVQLSLCPHQSRPGPATPAVAMLARFIFLLTAHLPLPSRRIPAGLAVATLYRFGHAGEVVLTQDRSNLEPAISRAIGTPVLKLTIDATAKVPLMFEMSNPSIVNGRVGKPSATRNSSRSSGCIQRHRQTVGYPFESRGLARRSLEVRDEITKLGRLLELECRRRLFHFDFELPPHLLTRPSRKSHAARTCSR
jgi:hypothetical protein